jgi:hypothetical protein
MSWDARLHSFDISPDSMKLAARVCDRRFKFLLRSQTDFDQADVDNRPVDLAFSDASHNFCLNVTTFESLMPRLAERGLTVVHDGN